MRITQEKRKKQYRTIYEKLRRDPRIYAKELAKVLGIDRDVASRRLKEAFEQGYISLPQVRKRSYKNTKEYIYLVKSENPLESFIQYKKDMHVIYHAVMGGFANLWIIASKEIDVEGYVIICGPRSDYYIVYAPNHSWDQAIENIKKKVRAFSLEEYSLERIIEAHWNETIGWDQEFEILSREFKYNLRRKLTPVMKNSHISADKIYRFFEKLPECCTILVRYFPDSISAYDPYLFMFETDYEDFVIDLFSELPTSSFFFKVADKLFLHAFVERSSIRRTGLDMSDISQLHIPLIAKSLLKKGIIKSETHAIIEYHWGKNL
jgi:DNA-binding Lrp family transcriptional regulator